MKAEIIIRVESPTECSKEDFKEWLEWEFKLRADIKLTNTLCDYEINPQEMESEIKILS